MWEEWEEEEHRQKDLIKGVKDALEKRGMAVGNAKVVCQNRSELRAFVSGGGIFNDAASGDDTGELTTLSAMDYKAAP